MEGEHNRMESKTEEKISTPPLEAPQPSNLAAPSGGTVIAQWNAPVWDSARVALAKKMVCPPNTTEDEFQFFLAWCQRTGLDPFIQQAYLVPRKQKDAAGKYVEKMQPMASVGGMAARADALPDFRGMRSGIVYAGDEFMVDEDEGRVIHKWSLEARAKAGTKDPKTGVVSPVLIGAWAHAKRDGRAVPVTFLTLAERDPQNGSPFWLGTKGHAQLRKCCESEQYRKAFPNIFAGVYTEAETMHGEREVNAPPEAPSKSPTGKSDALKAKLGVRTVDAPKSVDVATAPNPNERERDVARLRA